MDACAVAAHARRIRTLRSAAAPDALRPRPAASSHRHASQRTRGQEIQAKLARGDLAANHDLVANKDDVTCATLTRNSGATEPTAGLRSVSVASQICATFRQVRSTRCLAMPRTPARRQPHPHMVPACVEMSARREHSHVIPQRTYDRRATPRLCAASVTLAQKLRTHTDATLPQRTGISALGTEVRTHSSSWAANSASARA